MPEQSLAYSLRRQNFTMRFMGYAPGANRVPWQRGYISEWSKYAKTAPPAESVVWHAHNVSNVRGWIDADARMRKLSARDRRRQPPSDSVHLRTRLHTCASHPGRERLEGGAWMEK